MVTRDLSFSFCIPAAPLNMNNPDGPGARREYVKRKQLWAEAAYMATVAAFSGKGPKGRAMAVPATVRVLIPVAGQRRRDRSNWQPTVKVIVDQLVLAGVFEDDELVEQPNPELYPVMPSALWRSDVFVRITT
jgi:hypothetical protein